ncbi:hypothetical protein ACE1SV_33710 [Streptomyces sp. E-15]
MSDFDQRSQRIRTQTNNYYSVPPPPSVPPKPPGGNRRTWMIVAAAVAVVATAAVSVYVVTNGQEGTSGAAHGGTRTPAPRHSAPAVTTPGPAAVSTPPSDASPSAATQYTQERTGRLRLAQPDNYFVIDFDAQQWVTRLTDERYAELTEEEKGHYELLYRNSLWGDLEPGGERTTGLLAPGEKATTASCLDAAGSVPLSTTQLENAGESKANGVVEGATLCTVTDEGRVVASRITDIERVESVRAPVVSMDVTVWKPAG